MKLTSNHRPRAGMHAARALAQVAGVLLTVGATTVLAAPAQAADHTIVIKQYAYTPAMMSVSEGDIVTWTNQDSAAHDVQVTQGPVAAKSPLLQEGQSWSFTFKTAGTYSYVCSIHPDMKASVTVKAGAPAKVAAPAAPAPAPPAAPAPTPAPAPSAHVEAPSPTAAAGQQAAPVVDASQPELAAASVRPTLDPLLLVAGVAAAVMVFCLLLMSSRPATQARAPRRRGETPA